MSGLEEPTILVIVGISGDLSKRYLLPALRQLYKTGELPKALKVVGISRRELMFENIAPVDNAFWRSHLQLHQMDLTKVEDYYQLGELLAGINKTMGGKAQKLFYLSVPPQASQGVVQLLGESGLAKVPRTKLLLEKPFGSDPASAQQLVDHITKYFDEDQVYRIDHYLAKEMAQNLVIFRAGNPLIAQTWNSDFIDSIEIEAAESIGIEGRAAFYEQTGALRDVVQSHLMQLAALTLMDLPKLDDWQAIPRLRLKSLKQLQLDGSNAVVRGQYKGYKEDAKNPDSTVETFVSLRLKSTDPRWEGVPITLTAGKALNAKHTQIRLIYKTTPPYEANFLTMKIQPDEGVEVCLWAKKPGYEHQMQLIPLSFDYKQSAGHPLPKAYERVFVDAMRSDHSLFATSQEVLAAWQVLQSVQEAWAKSSKDLVYYKSGSLPEAVAKH